MLDLRIPRDERKALAYAVDELGWADTVIVDTCRPVPERLYVLCESKTAELTGGDGRWAMFIYHGEVLEDDLDEAEFTRQARRKSCCGEFTTKPCAAHCPRRRRRER